MQLTRMVKVARVLGCIDPGKPEGTRSGKVIALPVGLHSIWGIRAIYIAQLELPVVLVALAEVAGSVRGANTIRFIMRQPSWCLARVQVQRPILSDLNPQRTGRMR